MWLSVIAAVLTLPMFWFSGVILRGLGQEALLSDGRRPICALRRGLIRPCW